MHNPIQILKNQFKLPIDVPTEHGHETSTIIVMQTVTSWDLARNEYIANISKLLDAPLQVDWNNKHMPKYIFGYMVQNLVNNYRNGVVEEILSVYSRSIAQAEKYIEANPWVFATGEDENAPRKLDANGNPQPAKGDKKVLAKKLWVENQGKIATRKGWIELLCKEVGMTPAGASTYYHNLKTGVY